MNSVVKIEAVGSTSNRMFSTPIENVHYHLKEGVFKDLFFFDPFVGKVYISPNEFGMPANAVLEDRYVEEFRYIARNEGLGLVGHNELERLIKSTCMNFNRRDSLLEYFESLPEWDGVHRIASFLASYCGADNTEYHSVISRKFMISGVARGYATVDNPAKVDAVLVLEGKQGIGKTSLLAALCPVNSWARTINGNLEDKDTKIKLHSGVFMAEFSEFASIKKATANEYVKSFISETCDSFRPPYARNEVIHPRRNVFIGTINPSAHDGYLTDQTGNRRFWVAKVGDSIDLEGIRRDQDQIWAEAKFEYQQDSVWWLEGNEINLHDAEVAKRVVCNEYADLLEEYLAKHTDINEISIDTVMLEMLGESIRTSPHFSRIRKMLASAASDAGLNKVHKRKGNVWVRPISTVSFRPLGMNVADKVDEDMECSF
jgi:predicted P-loop ATPase